MLRWLSRKSLISNPRSGIHTANCRLVDPGALWLLRGTSSKDWRPPSTSSRIVFEKIRFLSLVKMFYNIWSGAVSVSDSSCGDMTWMQTFLRGIDVYILLTSLDSGLSQGEKTSCTLATTWSQSILLEQSNHLLTRPGHSPPGTLSQTESVSKTNRNSSGFILEYLCKVLKHSNIKCFVRLCGLPWDWFKLMSFNFLSDSSYDLIVNRHTAIHMGLYDNIQVNCLK